MNTEDIEVLPVKQSPSGSPSQTNTKMKSNSSSNVHNLKNESMPKNTAPMNRKAGRTRSMPIAYDISVARKIRIAKYTTYILFCRSFTAISIRSKIFYSVPFSIRLFVAVAVFTSIAITTSILIVYFTSIKPSKFCVLIVLFGHRNF